MLGKRFARIVEECLHRLDRGEDLPDVLADYPAEAEQLKPLLLIAMASRSISLPVPSQTAHSLARDQMLAEMDQASTARIFPGSSLYVRLKGWAAGLIHARRAQLLIQPAPSYRLAMIVLVVVFGSGIFFLSASASPGDLLNAFASDFQQIMAILNWDSPGNTLDAYRLISFYGGDSPPFAPNQKAKVAFQLDELDEDENPEIAGSTWRMQAMTSSQDPKDPPDPFSDDVHQFDPGTVDTPTPDPHPAAFVEEVVSETAIEMNPVWDQLPFNQTAPDAPDGCDDQEDPDQLEECEGEDSQTGPPTWVLDKREDKDNDDSQDD